MHEDLIGYLLGALEPEEMRRIRDLLQEDADLRAELQRIEDSLRPLEDCPTPSSPSEDLVSRTLDSLPPLPAPDSQPLSTQTVSLNPMTNGVEQSDRQSASWLDWVSGSVAVAILLGLLLPAIAQGRFESRRQACQDQLRQFGTVLTFYVMRSHQESLPAVAPSGREAFAGVYALRLNEMGLLPDPEIRWCPSLNPPSDKQRHAGRLVSMTDLHQSTPNRLEQIQQLVGGHYNYTLGIGNREAYRPPRYESRSSFAVMSDGPIQSSESLDSPKFGHSGQGINILFEDGHTQFVTANGVREMLDNPLQNHLGISEAGVDPNDSSLGPSWQGPFLDANQQ